MPTAEQTAVVDEAQLEAKRIFDSVLPELILVEQEFERQAQSNIQVIAYIGEYLRRSGGKRVRVQPGAIGGGRLRRLLSAHSARGSPTLTAGAGCRSRWC